MPDPGSLPTTAWEWIKTFAPWLTGGVVGAIITAIITNNRNKIQPVSKRLYISYIDLPKIVESYCPLITLKMTEGEGEKSYYFERLAIVQLNFVNTGNKDYDAFDLGIDVLDGSSIISIHSSSQDRYHEITTKQDITIATPTPKIDLVLKPFHRKNSYKITLLVNTPSLDLADKITLSHKLPIKFVDADINYKVGIKIATTAVNQFYPFSGIISRVFANIKRNL